MRLQAVRRGETPDTIKELLQNPQRLDDIWGLDNALCFGANFQQVQGEMPSVRTESRRWRDLNEIHDEIKVRKKSYPVDSSKLAESNGGEWSATTKSVLAYERYKQQRMAIPGDTMEFLFTYLAIASRAIGGFLDASAEAKRHFNASVLMTLCSLMDGIEVGFGQNVDGDKVRAQGHFDFVLTRGTKEIWIVKVQDGDFHQARAQVLIGCEAVADREGQRVVYGVVTDFVSWWFLRCGETSIRMNSCRLFLSSGELGIASLQTLCEMVCGVLANYEEDKKEPRSGDGRECFSADVGLRIVQQDWRCQRHAFLEH